MELQAARAPFAALRARAPASGGNAWQRFVGVQRNTDVFFKRLSAVVSGRGED